LIFFEICFFEDLQKQTSLTDNPKYTKKITMFYYNLGFIILPPILQKKGKTEF